MPNDLQTQAFFLPHVEGDYRQALTLGSNWPHPKERNRKPCHYWWKEVLRPERFKDIEGREWEILPEQIEQAVNSFRLARDKAKFEPPLPASHKDKTGKNYGYIVDARKSDKGSLELLHQFIGDEEANEALNKKSSVGILFDQTDAYGNHYPVIVDHNAILPDPQLTDLEDFKPALAASKDQPVRAVVLTLAREKEPQMAATPDQVDYVKRECYGGMNADHVDKDNAMDHLIAHHTVLKRTHSGMRLSKEDRDRLSPTEKQLTLLKLSREQVDSLAAPDPQIAELAKALDAEKAKVLELSKSPAAPKTTDPEVYFERRLRIAKTGKDNLVLRLGKEHAEKLMDKLLGSESKPNTLLLSRDSDAPDCRAAEIIDLIASAPVTPGTGSTTRAQVLERPDPSGGAQLELSKEQQNKEPNLLIEKAKAMGVIAKQTAAA